MSKFFISYRHIEPDQRLAGFLNEFLIRHNHKVFIDTSIPPGKKWAKEIEKHIKSSDYFIVLLSKESILSDMVRKEVELAYQEMKKRGDSDMILPIRLDFSGELPYDLGAHLDPIQYALWRPNDDFEMIARQILTAIEEDGTLPLNGISQDDKPSHSGMQDLFDVTDGIGAPLPAADPRLPGLDKGSIKLDSPYYVRRKADEEIMNQIRLRGSTTNVKGSRQMGKSSLLARAHAEAQKKQYQSYYFDFRLIGNSDLTSLERLFRVLAAEMAKELKTSIKPNDVWDDRGPQLNFTDFIEKALLETTQAQTLTLFDNVDRLFDYSFRDEFFSTLRTWHDRRSRKDCWNRLNLVIAYSTEPHIWIKDINLSPFNVGLQIRLEDFNFQQVAELNTRHGVLLKEDEAIRELLKLTGGQPYLVRSAFYKMAKDHCSLSQLKEIAADNSGPFGDHLRQLLWSLHREKGLIKSLRQVLKKGRCKHEIPFLRLRSAGLVKGETKKDVQMRCQIYRDYFRKHL